MRSLLVALCLLWSPATFAQGVINIALAQQVNANGIPLAGALLYVYQVGTVATPQQTFQDFGLTLPNPWPLQADSTGRIPMFYLANGQVHVRLTDATGVVIFDYPTMQVVGPSGGGGGGGGSIDPTSVMSTGDIKFRPTSEVVTGWVKINGQTIGSAGSGATGRANADTQNLFVYLWTNCTTIANTHCPVSSGRGATALADFNANKQMTLPDWRGRIPVGLDDMGAMAAGRIPNTAITSGGGDTPTTPMATGGEATHTQLAVELAFHGHPITDPHHAHTFSYNTSTNFTPGGGITGMINAQTSGGVNSVTTSSVATGILGADPVGSSQPFNVMQPFALGTWYLKL